MKFEKFIRLIKNFRRKRGCGLIAIALISALGIVCFWQSYAITQLYLEYRVVDQITIKVPDELPIPSVSLCSYTPGLIDRRKLADLLTSRGKSYDALEYSRAHNVMEKLTLQDLFELTPKAHQILKDCKYRIKRSYLTWNLGCNQVIYVRKYFYLNYICYRFSQKLSAWKLRESSQHVHHEEPFENNTHHSRKEIGGYIVRDDKNYFKYRLICESLSFNNLFMEVILDKETFNNVTLFSTQFTSAQDFPRGIDSYPAIVLQRRAGNTLNLDSKEIIRRLFVSYQFVQNRLLPPPYETRCRDYSKSSNYNNENDCKDTCILYGVTSQLGRIPQMSVIMDGYVGGSPLDLDISLIKWKDMINDTFKSKLYEIEDSCFKQCGRKDCTENIYVTNVRRTETSDNRYNIKLMGPHAPSIKCVSSPKLTFTQFVILLLNCLTFWFGFSVLKVSQGFKVIGLEYLRKRSCAPGSKWRNMKYRRIRSLIIKRLIQGSRKKPRVPIETWHLFERI